ncbi:MAG: response regulator [Lachnospiraceae bacterium]|nr:response regulator [Lachnospiraceae bacterium]
MKSFRVRMTILIVLMVLGISLFLSFFSYQRAKKSLIMQVEDNYGVDAQRYSLELSSWVSTNATIIDTLAAELAVNDITSKGYDEFHEYLKHSNELLNKNGYVYDVYFTYPNNYMVCASDFMADGSVDFVHEREWYTTSALTGELFYSIPYLDSDTQKPIITISKAVYKDDKLLGVLAADIFVDVLVDMVNKANVEEDSYAFLLDLNMNAIVHPNEVYDYEDKPINLMDAPDAPYKELVEAIRRGQDEMVFVKDYDGLRRGIVYSQMYNTGWYVCIATSEKVLEKDVSSMTRGFVVAAIVAIMIGVVLAFFLARVLDKLNKQEQEYQEKVLMLEKQSADEANKAKSRFLADMSHEIRTPINAIIGMNEMILRESDDKEIKGYSQMIKQSGNNLLELISGILDFSKIEDGKMDIVPVRYSVANQIVYYENSISERAKAKNLELVFHIDENLPSELYGDDTRINQVVMNLLTNAVKYTQEGRVTLGIKEKERNSESGEVRIYYEVKDTGIGIRKEDMEKLFESFERLDVIKNRNIEGTGLGMAITQRLLKLMGSELKVESEYGVGSEFSFELVQKIENEEPLGNYKEVMLNTGDSEHYRELFRAPEARILVVDDTKMNILVIENLLKKTEMKIDSAMNGSDAVFLAIENSYDVILMDQRMPGMDGTEAMKRIREPGSGKNDKTPIICLTADVISGAKERYMELGFDGYLMKPVDASELERTICNYLPKEKVQIIKNAAEEKTEEDIKNGDNNADNTSEEKKLLNALTALGINTESGLFYCGSEWDLYKEILSDYASDEEAKSAKIQECRKNENWEDYGILTHSLKSTSRTIGADGLADLAAELEAAAKSKDIKTIEEKHEETMKRYEDLAKQILENLKQ